MCSLNIIWEILQQKYPKYKFDGHFFATINQNDIQYVLQNQHVTMPMTPS